MSESNRTGTSNAVALAVVALLAACQPKDGSTTGGTSSTAAASSAPSSKAASKASADKSTPSAPSGTAVASNGGDDDIDKIVDAAPAADQSGMLSVDLSKVDDKAPSLGANTPPPAAASGAPPLSWLNAGSFLIPNPGLKPTDSGGFTIMPMPGKGAVLLFRGVKDDAELKKVSTDFLTALKLKEAKFNKSKAVVLGPDKIPAQIGGGHIVFQDGKAGKLAFGVILGQPHIFMVMSAGDGAPASDEKLALEILDHVKKK